MQRVRSHCESQRAALRQAGPAPRDRQTACVASFHCRARGGSKGHAGTRCRTLNVKMLPHMKVSDVSPALRTTPPLCIVYVKLSQVANTAHMPCNIGTDRPGAAEGSCSEHTAQGCPGHSHLSSSTCPNTARTALQHSDGPDPNQYLQAVTADNDRRDVVGKGDGVGQVLRRCMVKLAHRDAYVAPLHLPPLFRANRIERGTLEIQNALEFGLQPTSGWLVKHRQGPHGPLTNHKRVLRSITFSTS